MCVKIYLDDAPAVTHTGDMTMQLKSGEFEIVRETEKAVLIGFDTDKGSAPRQVWIPKSQFSFAVNGDGFKVATVPQWWVSRNRLWPWVSR